MAAAFNNVGAISGVINGSPILVNPTTLQFGPDGRLYVTEQDGTIDIFTVGVQAGKYVATSVEVVNLVKNIQNHNDDGANFSPATQTRQLTGMLVTGSAENPVIYATTSDPRIATEQDANLDTNSGVLTKLTWTGSSWSAVDLIRGLPRSEENHAPNGMALSPDGQALYLTVGGNTNNGAPSSYFANTAEYALSASVLAISLPALNALPVKTDTTPGLNNGRKYVYDLPTLDDPNTPNNGVRENAAGLDVQGPWGGRDGLNQAVLPAGAPISIYATGLRNAYDLEMTADGRLYTVDNGSNAGLGGNPVIVGGEATNQISNGGTGSGEPLFLLQQGGYYGHPNPTRSNQNQSWTVRNDAGNPDTSLAVPTVADVSALVPASVSIADGFLIDPSKFTSNQTRLTEEGLRVAHPSAGSKALAVIGSSSNGLVEYTANNFAGELKGDILVAQFNGNVARLDVNATGTTATYATIPGLSGLATPLDVTVGPEGTLWVAEIGGDRVSVFAPSDIGVPANPDTDADGLLNKSDPFLRDASNGRQAFIQPNSTIVWDFDANLDGNRPGPSGYGGGLTGVMIDGVTDFDAFFNEAAEFPLQNIKLDNVKFTTAAGGGTTVIENASTGSATGAANTGKYLFHTGATVMPSVDKFTVQLTTVNPFGELGGSSGPSQQIGAYIGTGDQSNFLKLVAVHGGAAGGQIQFSLENGNQVGPSSSIAAPGLLTAPLNTQVLFEVLVDRVANTATPKVTYGLSGGGTNTVTGGPISIAGSNVNKAIDGEWVVGGQPSGLALGLYASNIGQTNANTFQAIFSDLKVIGEGPSGTVGTPIYRVNAGGAQVAALDGGMAWSADTATSPSPYLASISSGTSIFTTASSSAYKPVNASHPSIPPGTPAALFDNERFDAGTAPNMAWAFPVQNGTYKVNLYFAELYTGIDAAGERVFDVSVEGTVPAAFDNVDSFATAGPAGGFMWSATVAVSDGTLNLTFLRGIQNPVVDAIEIIAAPVAASNTLTVRAGGTGTAAVPPKFEVLVDGVSLGVRSITSPLAGSFNVGNDANFQNYAFSFSGPEPQTVSIRFINDGTSSGIDRNLFVDYIALNGEVFESELAGFVTTANPASQAKHGGVRESLFVNGTLTFDDLGGGTNALPVIAPIADFGVDEGHPASFAVGASDSDSDPLDLSVAVVRNSDGLVVNPADYLFADYGNGTASFRWQTDNADAGVYTATVTANDGSGTDTETLSITVRNAPAIQTPAQILLAQTDLQTNATYAPGVVGSAALRIMEPIGNIRASNFSSGSFQVENTGGKKISGIFIDARGALYPDFVFDPDGAGGDNVTKPWAIDSAGNTGAFVTGTGYFLPGASPLPNTTGTGQSSNGGFLGAMVKFNAAVSAGFQTGEKVGFSGDMDPNSLAGLLKTGVDGGALLGWDVGGVSGHELIGSDFVVLFNDGSTASGQLMAGNNVASAQAFATQSPTNEVAGLTVNGVGPGGAGTYGGARPSVIVTADPGETVRITMTKGFNPVTNNANGIANLVRARLADDVFKANNAFDNQTVDVVIGASGVFNASHLFDYDDVSPKITNVAAFPGDDVAQIGFVAGVVSTATLGRLPKGPLTDPIYLTNVGGPVPDAAASALALQHGIFSDEFLI